MAQYHFTIRVRTEDSTFKTLLLEERLVSITTPKKAKDLGIFLAQTAAIAKQLIYNGLKAIKRRQNASQ
jgi:hypothetical protein